MLRDDALEAPRDDRVVVVDSAAFDVELGQVGLVEESAPKALPAGVDRRRGLREKVRAGQLPDPRIMRPETAKVLIERMKTS